MVSAASLENIVTGVNSTNYTWMVNLPAQTSVTLKLTDATGAIAYSSNETIQAGFSTSCLNSSLPTAPGGGAGSASSSGASSGSSVSPA